MDLAEPGGPGAPHPVRELGSEVVAGGGFPGQPEENVGTTHRTVSLLT